MPAHDEPGGSTGPPQCGRPDTEAGCRGQGGWSATARTPFGLVAGRHGVPSDPAEASRLEVEWWRVHPEHSGGPAADASPMVGGLVATLSNVYRVPAAEVGPAARLRAEAMDPSDRSAPSGRGGDRPPEIARTLVGCYTSLPDTVDR